MLDAIYHLSFLRQVIAPLLQTLEVVHQRGVIHRDIKPENLLVSEGGVVKLGDWGLAINQLQEKAYSRVGTLDYMAPEVGLHLNLGFSLSLWAVAYGHSSGLLL